MLFDSSTQTAETTADEYAVAAPQYVPAVPFVSFGLIAINLALFAAMVVSGVSPLSPDRAKMIAWGADFGPLTFSGQWWRMFTACFLHFGIIHVAMNMFVLFQVGPFTERLFGNLRFLVLYVMAGLGGNLLSLYVHPLSVAAGASGAIFGVYGGLLAFLLMQRGVIVTEAARRIARSAAIFLAYNLIYGIASPTTDLVAHGGGLVAGFLAGCGLALPLFPKDAMKSGIRAAMVVVAGGVVGVVAAHFLKKNGASQNDWSRLVATAPHITVGNKDVLVYSGVSEADAQKFGQALAETGFLHSANIMVLWSKTAGSNSLSVPMNGDETLSPTYDNFSSKLVDGKTVVTHSMEKRPPLPWDDPQNISTMQVVGGHLVAAAGGPPFTIRLLNTKGELRREIPITTTEITQGLDRVSYSGRATADDARTLAGALKDAGYFKNAGGLVFLKKGDDGATVSFLMKDGSGANPAISAYLTKLGPKLAYALGAKLLKVDVIDRQFRVQNEIEVTKEKR